MMPQSSVLTSLQRTACATRFATVIAGLVCALAVLPIRLNDIGHFDEGFIATGAMILHNGTLPLRDFYSTYGPAQYALNALLYSVFGADLLVSRLADVAFLGLTGALLFACVRRLADAYAGWLSALAFIAITVIFHPSANYPAVSTLPLFLGAALLFGNWVQTGCLRELTGTSILVGVVAALRWDFGLFGLTALGFSISAVAMLRYRRTAIRYILIASFVPALVVVSFVYVPLLAGHVLQWFNEVPKFLWLEFENWRNVELLRPALLVLRLNLKSGDFAKVSNVLLILSLVTGPCLVLPAAAWRTLRCALKPHITLSRSTGTALFLSLVGLFLLNQLRVRSTELQALPSTVVALTLLAWTSRSFISVWPAMRVVAVVSVMLLCWTAFEKYRQRSWQTDDSVILERARGIRLPKGEGWHEYAALVAHVKATTSPDEVIFSGVTDMSRLFVNDAMLYFLAARRPATRFIEMEPGLANTKDGQQELIGELERYQVRTVVLWQILSSEPNRTAVSNGVTLLDDHIHRHFTATAQFGMYTVFVRHSAAK